MKRTLSTGKFFLGVSHLPSFKFGMKIQEYPEIAFIHMFFDTAIGYEI